MDIKQKKLLKDVLDSIVQIEIYLGSSRVFEVYDKNLLLQDAIERNLITIGEAISALLKLENDIPISNIRKIVDTRNRLTHGYDQIDNMQIWNIIINHLPILKLEVEYLLN